MKYCRYCGFQVDGKAQFCRRCGAKLAIDQPNVTYLSQSQRVRGWSKTKIITITVLLSLISIVAVLFFEYPTIFQPLGIGIIEEVAKLLGPIFIAVQAPYFLKTKKATLSLAIASALTFLLIEDAIYVIFYGASIFVRLIIFPVHLLWTGIAAFGVSLAVMKLRNEPELKRKFFKAYLTEGPLTLLVVSILLHSTWDYSALVDETSVFVVSLGIVYVLSVMIFIKAYRHFPHDMTTYRYQGVVPMLKRIIGL